MKLRILFSFGLLCAVMGSTGCVHVTLDPIKVHAVVDVNVKVDRALTDFFGDLDQKSAVLHAPTP